MPEKIVDENPRLIEKAATRKTQAKTQEFQERRETEKPEKAKTIGFG